MFESLTGATANSARAFGPDVVDAVLGVPVNWLVFLVCYLLGPIIGGIIAVNMYSYLADQPKSEPLPEPASGPISDDEE